MPNQHHYLQYEAEQPCYLRVTSALDVRKKPADPPPLLVEPTRPRRSRTTRPESKTRLSVRRRADIPKSLIKCLTHQDRVKCFTQARHRLGTPTHPLAEGIAAALHSVFFTCFTCQSAAADSRLSCLRMSAMSAFGAQLTQKSSDAAQSAPYSVHTASEGRTGIAGPDSASSLD